MSEPSSSDESDSSDGEGGLFGGAMKSMFKESDMKKEFVYTYNLPSLNSVVRRGKRRLQDFYHKFQWHEVAVKLIGIHESWKQQRKLVIHCGCNKLAKNMVVPKSDGGLYEYFFPNLNRPTKVLELGAGLGLCGILASKLDAGRGRQGPEGEGKSPKIQVVVTDGDSKVLDGIRDNIELNYNTRTRISPRGNSVGVLNTSTIFNISVNMNQATTSVPKGDDEKKFNLAMKDAQTAKFFDITGSDIIYDECVIPDLFDTGKCLRHGNMGNREQILTSPTVEFFNSENAHGTRQVNAMAFLFITSRNIP